MKTVVIDNTNKREYVMPKMMPDLWADTYPTNGEFPKNSILKVRAGGCDIVYKSGNDLMVCGLDQNRFSAIQRYGRIEYLLRLIFNYWG